jgi:hypothetical protein
MRADRNLQSNGKRSPAELTARRLPTITAPKIPPLGAPTGGVDGGGYLRRSLPTGNDDTIVIGSRRSPEEPAPAEDVGAYDEEKRSLSLDAAGHPILTGDNYPTKRHLVVDGEDYPPEDGTNYEKREAMLPIDGDYPVPNDDSYPVKAKRLLDAGIYEPDN